MKNIFLSTLLCLGFFSLISCGGDTNYEKDYKNYEKDYKDACAEQDWEKAYQWVEKYKEEADKNRIEAESVNPGWYGSGKSGRKRYRAAIEKYEDLAEFYQSKYEEGIRYVAFQECIYVIENHGINGMLRVIGIAKEHNLENWLYPELLDVARKIGDEELEERFKKIMTSSDANKQEKDDLVGTINVLSIG